MSYLIYCFAEFRYDACAECRYAEYRGVANFGSNHTQSNYIDVPRNPLIILDDWMGSQDPIN